MCHSAVHSRCSPTNRYHQAEPLDVSQCCPLEGETLCDFCGRCSSRIQVGHIAVQTDCRCRERFINWDERKSGPNALWNHCAHFDSVHTVIWDGFPAGVWKPNNWEPTFDKFGGRDLKSGKYNSCVFKYHVAIGFHGLIHAVTGPAIGVDHDAKLYMWDTSTVETLNNARWYSVTTH